MFTLCFLLVIFIGVLFAIGAFIFKILFPLLGIFLTIIASLGAIAVIVIITMAIVKALGVVLL